MNGSKTIKALENIFKIISIRDEIHHPFYISKTGENNCIFRFENRKAKTYLIYRIDNINYREYMLNKTELLDIDFNHEFKKIYKFSLFIFG